MKLTWIQTPYLNLDYIATKLYGSKSRLYTMRLRKKISGIEPFEVWEIEGLSRIKEHLFNELNTKKELILSENR